MSDWVRSLFLTAGASGEWHAARSRGFTTVTYCEEKIEGPLEIAREEKAEREGRCSTCATRLVAPQGIAPLMATGAVPTALRSDLQGKAAGLERDIQRRPQPRAHARQAAVKQAVAKNVIKKPAPRKTSGNGAVAKRPVGRSPRGRA